MVNGNQVGYTTINGGGGNFLVQTFDVVSVQLYGNSGNVSNTEVTIYEGSGLMDSSVNCSQSGDSQSTILGYTFGANGTIYGVVENGLGGCL